MAKRTSTKYYVENKMFDTLLVIELEKQRLFPNRVYATHIGVFCCLYDLMPLHTFGSMLITRKELKKYFIKYMHQQENVDNEAFDKEHGTVRLAHNYLEVVYANPETCYLINTKHKLELLDDN